MRRYIFAIVFTLAVIAMPDLNYAAETYEIKLKNGAVYKVDKVDADTFRVSNSTDQPVGTVNVSGGKFTAFSTGGASLGTAARLNPDALTLIDTYLRGGGK
jgi:hypothetical protein